MLVIGIAGGVGSGKSSVASELASRGAAILDADQIGHDLLDETEVQDQLVRRWGSHVRGPAGAIDREAVAEIVFGETAEALNELCFLEELVHPRIARRLESMISELKEDGEVEVVVLDAAVMFKTGGWTAEEFRYREANQESLELKRNRADWLVDNSGTRQRMAEQITEIWDQRITLES